jgi:hypothetical protein
MDESFGAMVNQGSRFAPTVETAHQVQPSPVTPLRASVAGRVWSAANRNPGCTLAGVVVFYLAIAGGQAATKLLWCDELITLAIARQGSLAAIWRALAGGADPNPPLSHWLVLEATRMFGQSALAVRLPAILCVLLAIVSLWAILRRWVCPGYAAVGVLAFMATRGFDYAYDARSYAPLMGFTMAAVALWLAACDSPETGRRWPPQNGVRLAALMGMAASLVLALSSNYYGVLAFLPIAAGEIILTVRKRRLKPGTWLAMAAAALPLCEYLPLIRHNLAEFGPHAWNRPRASMISDSYLELVEGVFWPVLGLALYAAWRRWRRLIATTSVGGPSFQRPLLKGSVASTSTSLQPHETAALAVLLLYPLLGFQTALLGHGMISPRCVAPVCCGFGIAAALLASRTFGAGARAGVFALSIALVWVAARESACAYVLAGQRTAFFQVRDEVARQPGNQPIAVADSLLVLPLARYSSDDVRDRIVFPIDFDAIHRLEPDDSGEQNLWAGREGLFPVHIVAYAPSIFAGPTLTVVARPGGWLAQRLAGDGLHLDETTPQTPWQSLGGVFTPLAHEDTRILTGHRF